jgi:hypothetical protein
MITHMWLLGVCTSEDEVSQETAVLDKPLALFPVCDLNKIAKRIADRAIITDHNALISRRWISDVFTAVSIRPSRPTIAWKTNSWGVSPRRYEFPTNLQTSGLRSSLAKSGEEGKRNSMAFALRSAMIWVMKAVGHRSLISYGVTNPNAKAMM